MKHLLIALSLLMFTGIASAEISTTGLTKVQAAEIELQVQRLKEQSGLTLSRKVPTVKAAKEWVEVGNAIGEGLAGAAGKLGVEVNKFADTTVGKFTMFVIAWSYMGQEMVNIVFGLLMFFLGVPTWIWMYRTRGSRRVDSETKYEKGKGPDGKLSFVTYRDTSEATKGWYVGILLLLMVLGTLTIII